MSNVSKKRKSVPTYFAPADDAFGVSSLKNKNNFDKRSSSEDKFRFQRDEKDNGSFKKSRKKELSGLYSEVIELSSSTYTGMAKKKKNEDVLTRLGVDAPKQQTMPLRMALGIKAGREKRARKARDDARESGVLSSLGSKSKNSREDNKRNDSMRRGDVGLDVHTKGGIMHISKKKFKGGFRNS